MSKPIIHFSHANGFPAECYRKFFHYLSADFEVGFLNTVAHNPSYRVTDGWACLVNELIDTIVQSYSVPIIGMGHSLGGVLTFLACIKRPELFSQIILLDSPILGRFRSTLVKCCKHLGLMGAITPAGRVKSRRQSWPDVDTAIAYFKQRRLFKHFDPDCLKDYVIYGTTASPAGLSLKFDREIEYQIYCTLPHDLYRFRGKLKVPATLFFGEDSDIIRQFDLNEMRKHYGIQAIQTKGGHLFPFEYPGLSAQQICKEGYK